MNTEQWMVREVGAPGTHLELFYSLGDANLKSAMTGGWMDVIMCGNIGWNYDRSKLNCSLWVGEKMIKRTAIQYASKPRFLNPQEMKLLKKELREWEEDGRQRFMKCIWNNPNERR
jgi:hypothetical protein